MTSVQRIRDARLGVSYTVPTETYPQEVKASVSSWTDLSRPLGFSHLVRGPHAVAADILNLLQGLDTVDLSYIQVHRPFGNPQISHGDMVMAPWQFARQLTHVNGWDSYEVLRDAYSRLSERYHGRIRFYLGQPRPPVVANAAEADSLDPIQWYSTIGLALDAGVTHFDLDGLATRHHLSIGSSYRSAANELARDFAVGIEAWPAASREGTTTGWADLLRSDIHLRNHKYEIVVDHHVSYNYSSNTYTHRGPFIHSFTDRNAVAPTAVRCPILLMLQSWDRRNNPLGVPLRTLFLDRMAQTLIDVNSRDTVHSVGILFPLREMAEFNVTCTDIKNRAMELLEAPSSEGGGSDEPWLDVLMGLMGDNEEAARTAFSAWRQMVADRPLALTTVRFLLESIGADPEDVSIVLTALQS